MCLERRSKVDKALLAKGIPHSIEDTDDKAASVVWLTYMAPRLEQPGVRDLLDRHRLLNQIHFKTCLCQFATTAALCIYATHEWYDTWAFYESKSRSVGSFLTVLCLLRLIGSISQRSPTTMIGSCFFSVGIAILWYSRFALATVDGEITRHGLGLCVSFRIVAVLSVGLVLYWKVDDVSSPDSGRSRRRAIAALARGSACDDKVYWTSEIGRYANMAVTAWYCIRSKQRESQPDYLKGCELEKHGGATRTLGQVLTVIILSSLVVSAVCSLAGAYSHTKLSNLKLTARRER